MGFLSGKKTFIGSVAMALLALLMAVDQFAHSAGTPPWIPATTYETIGGLIVAWLGTSIRFAIAKVDQKIETQGEIGTPKA